MTRDYRGWFTGKLKKAKDKGFKAIKSAWERDAKLSKGEMEKASTVFGETGPGYEYVQDRSGKWTIAKRGIKPGMMAAGGKMKNYFSNMNRPSAGTIAVIVIGVFVVGTGLMFTTQNTLFNSFLDNTIGPSWKAAINGISDQLKIFSCVVSNSYIVRLGSAPLDPSLLNQQDTGPDIFAYCQQQFVTAEDIGCTDCFELTAGSLQFSVPAEPGNEAIVRAVVRAVEEKYLQDGEDFPVPSADDVIFYIEDQDGTKANLDSTLQVLTPVAGTGSASYLTGRLNSAVLYSTPLIVEGYFDVSQMCSSRKTRIEADAVLNYSYRTDGQAYINVKKFSTKDASGAFTKRDSVAFPGPVKIDIIPDSNLYGGVYSADLVKNAKLEIKFRNAGTGSAVVKGLTITQTPPEGQAPLPITRCSGTVSSFTSESGGATVQTDIELGSGDRSSSSITCTLDLTGAAAVPGDYPQWRIDGSVFYNYEVVARAATIQIDKSSCQQSDLIAASDQGSSPAADGGAPTTGDTGGTDGSGGGEGSELPVCTSPAPEDKACPSGQTLLDNGCCG